MKPEILNDVLVALPDKTENPMTVSRRFKADLIAFFEPLGLERALEVASYQGQTTRILSFIFRQVIYTDEPSVFAVNSAVARHLNADRQNVLYCAHDAYRDHWPFPPMDMVLIDAGHTYDCVRSDIINARRVLRRGGYIVFDDIQYADDDFCVRRAVQDSGLRVVQEIGENALAGTANGWRVTPEGGKEGWITQADD